jgi:hypothetical protein
MSGQPEQKVESFTQKTFVFADGEGRTRGVRVLGQLAEAVQRWTGAARLRLGGFGPLFVPEPVPASPARVAQLASRLVNPDTGRVEEPPVGYDADGAITEHSLSMLAWGVRLPDVARPRQRVALFAQLDYSVIEREGGRIVATRSRGRISRAIEEWLEANRIRLGGFGHLYIRNPPREVPLAALDQAALVNPATRAAEPLAADPDRTRVIEYLTMLPVYGEEEDIQNDI